MNKLIIPIGLPASGKSTFAKALSREFTILSSDAVRKELYGDENRQDNPGKVFEIMRKRLVAALKENKNVIYDATNLSSKRRKNLIKDVRPYIKKNTKIIAVIFATPLDECLRRNNMRERKVPEHTIRRMLCQFEVPSASEGFDEIKIIRSKDRVTVYNPEWIKDYDSNNPHHDYTLDHHIKACKEYVQNKSPENSRAIIAASYHDIGKLFAREDDIPVGSEPSRSHYYGHEHASAYMAMCLLSQEHKTGTAIQNESLTKYILDVCLLIDMHMRPLNAWRTSENAKKRDYERLGSKEMQENLELLHEADVSAHGDNVPLYTPKSYICSFLYEYPNDWRKRLSDIGIKIKEEDDLAIFNYGIDCDFSDPVVAEARGIIINTKTLRVVCWPFTKFGNWGESYVKDVNWQTTRVQEKCDGSIIKLWFDHDKDQWRWSTNGTIDAKNALSGTNDIAFSETRPSFYDLIIKAIREHENNTLHKIWCFDHLDKNDTYIFELCTPENIVVVKHNDYKLWHIGTRNNITGKEFVCDIGFPHPKEYPLSDLNSCLSYLKTINKTDDNLHEGFVVVDAGFNRIKLKTEEYLDMHHSLTNHNLTVKSAIDIIRNKNFDTKALLSQYPDVAHILKFYEWQYEELRYKANRIASRAKSLYEEFSHERKAVAEILTKDYGGKWAMFGFAALDNKSIDELIENMPEKKIKNFILPYSETFMTKKRRNYE